MSGQPCETDEEATDEEATDEEATVEDCHILPLTGLNAFVYTGLNAQKLKVDGRMVGWLSDCTYSKSACSAKKKTDSLGKFRLKWGVTFC